MDLQQAYSKIDELYSQYVNTEEAYKNAIKSKLLKIVCDVINSDYKYKAHIDNGDFDYLPILTTTNDSIKFFPTSKNTSFHSYLFSNIKKAVNKDIAQNKRKGFDLNYSNVNELKKIKKLLHLYKNNKQKVADALDISLEKLNALLASELVDYFSKPIGDDDSEKDLGSTLSSTYDSIEDKIGLEDKLNSSLTVFDKVWKNIKPKHQEIISFWLTNITLSVLENSKSISFMENPEEAYQFLFRYSYIDRQTIQSFFSKKSFELKFTYDSIAEKFGITKSAVCKKIAIFTDELKKHINN